MAKKAKTSMGSKIQVASTFYDRESAEQSVSNVLRANESDLKQWLDGEGEQLTLLGREADPVGILVIPPDRTPLEGRGVKVVLRRNPTMSIGYNVHTVMVMQ